MVLEVKENVKEFLIFKFLNNLFLIIFECSNGTSIYLFKSPILLVGSGKGWRPNGIDHRLAMDWAKFSQNWPLSRKRQSDCAANTTTGHTFALYFSRFTICIHCTTEYGMLSPFLYVYGTNIYVCLLSFRPEMLCACSKMDYTSPLQSQRLCTTDWVWSEIEECSCCLSWWATLLLMATSNIGVLNTWV